MPTAEQIQQAIRNVNGQHSFINVLLRDTLNWPIELDFDPDIENITYEWTDDDLNAEGLSRDVLSGPVLQMQSLEQEHKQPWGIFILEFANETPFVTGQGLAGPLRKVLRGLVPKRRQRQANLRAWGREHLLFICTHNYRHFRFAYFKAPKEKGRAEPLTTFGWECGIPLRTVCEFNLGCLEWPQDPSDGVAWLKQWACAFDKEPLTREFFKRFDQVLERMKADLEEHQRLPSAEAYSRSQLLLERMIFAYFLQNRGWLNRQRNYLTDAFKPYCGTSDKFTFYEDALEPLFWTLASAPDSPSRCPGIPFLNGGLFDDDEFEPSLKRKKNNPPLRIRNSTFDYAFSHLLEAFNFTVREDTPLDQDVAVDPEMLGKVFESIVLHADAEAEYNAPDKRKATGSYYTPRIVVHFICREALRLYLKGQLPGPERDSRIQLLFEIDPTDGIEPVEMESLRQVFRAQDGRALLNILRNIKMCDPAVGSGAFPVGLLHELVNLRRIAETIANGFVDPARREGSNWIHETKADIVENCLYGVDIQQQAIEICRLRLWLSLIVDYDLGLDPFKADPTQFEDAIRKISQLPNLEMNFRRGDSLLDHICGVRVRVAPDNPGAYRPEYERIKGLGRRLHLAKKSDRKRELRIDILRCRLDLSARVLNDEIKALKTQDSLAATWFGETASETEKRRQIAAEISQLQAALEKVAAERNALEKIASRPYDASFYPELRKLEGADFDSPFNFSWRIDYADIFQNGSGGATANGKMQTPLPGGFDLILGNPPFVTARNAEKRELYRERWKHVCSGKYLLVCPFFGLSFGLLRRGGQLGFIVSNAFAKREFGKPLIEDFFPTVDLQKIVDCSGLLFPGHGTPTCIVFGRNQTPGENSSIRIAATLPGGGDLRTPPEESPLWRALESHHDEPGYIDDRISVADRPRKKMAKWPWNLDFSNDELKELLQVNKQRLRDFLPSDMGVALVTGANEVFALPPHVLRLYQVSPTSTVPYVPGEDVRNWFWEPDEYAIFPYSKRHEPISYKANSPELRWLTLFKSTLESRIYFGKTPAERGMQWYEYAVVVWPNCDTPNKLIFPDLATHCHFVRVSCLAAFNQHTPVLSLNASEANLHSLSALMNSSAALFWLKQMCFNKGAGEDEHRDRFEYAGGKVQQLPVPESVAETLRGKKNELAERLTAISQACWERGRQMPLLAMKKLFEKPGEAYHDWNASLPGYIAPDARMGLPFQTIDDLRTSFSKACNTREKLRGEMIALQEEMDWLVYAAYGLLATDDPAVLTSLKALQRLFSISASYDNMSSLISSGVTSASDVMEREQRPFVLWAQADGDFEKAVGLISAEWPDERRTLWRVRLEAIRDNEHIRRIEQPVYKRRWDEQWKVGNSWQCGSVAYDTEFVDAFKWWFSEKAEWWLEKKAGGGPVSLEQWSAAIWEDARVQAAWGVVREALERLERRADYSRYFATLVKGQSVPDNIPVAVPWEKIKTKVPAAVKRIRGKFNVPRERFRVTTDGHYVWAGMK